MCHCHSMVAPWSRPRALPTWPGLVQSAARILPTFPESLSAVAQGSLEQLGVEVRTGSRVEAVDELGVTIGEQQIPARTVLWAAAWSLPLQEDGSRWVVIRLVVYWWVRISPCPDIQTSLQWVTLLRAKRGQVGMCLGSRQPPSRREHMLLARSAPASLGNLRHRPLAIVTGVASPPSAASPP